MNDSVTLPITRALLLLNIFADTDDLRQLDVIRIGDGYAVATDGRRLTRFRFESGGREIFIPRDVAIAALKGSRKHTEWAVIDADGRVTLRRNDGVSWDLPSPTRYTYPNVDRVMPAARDNGEAWDAPTAVGFNPRYIGDIGAYMKKAKANNQGVRFQPGTDAVSAIRITPVEEVEGAFELVFVVMPVRL